MIFQDTYSYMGSYSERFNPKVSIGKFTSIGSGAIFYGTCQHPQTVSVYPFADKQWFDESVYPKSFSRGEIRIGNDCWIGEDVRIMDGITIGDGAIVGAGAVVSRDVTPYEIVVGNPIQNRGWRFTVAQIEEIQKMKWWNWSDEKIKEAIPKMKDINEFLNL